MPRNKNFSVYTPFICSHCYSIFNAFIKNINTLSHDKVNLSENQPIEPSLSNHKTQFQLRQRYQNFCRYTSLFFPLFCVSVYLFVCFITFS